MKLQNIFYLVLIALLVPVFSNAQAIVKGSGILYTNGAPTHSVSQNVDAEVALDTTTGYWYVYYRDLAAWGKAGFFIRKVAISVAPTGAPTDKESELVINDVDSIYNWRAGAWRHVNPGGDPSITNEGQIGVGAGGATSSVITSNTSGAVGVTINVGGINSITESTSSNGGSITITATEVDGSTTNELQTYAHSGTTSYTNTLSNSGGSFTLQATGIASISHSAGTVTISATEVDGSTSNELQTIANTSDATSHTVTLSNSGGSVQLVEGTGITLTTTGTSGAGVVTIASTSTGTTDLSYTGTSSPVTLNSSTGTDVTFTQGGIVTLSATGSNMTISATEVDGSTSNELQTYSHAGTTTYTNTLSNGGGSWSITGAGIAVISQTGGAVTVTATEVDGSVTNEGQIGVGAGGATSSVITSNTSGATGVTINVGGINSISETTSSNGGQITITATEVDGSTTNELQTYSHAGTTTYTNTLSNGGGSWSITGAGIAVISQTAGAVTVTATEVDGSTTNELQTIANTSDATSHTVTLSNSGGSIQLVEGANITLTTTGTSGAGVVTIAATSGGGTDLSYTGTSSPVTLNSSSGTDVTFTAGGINTFSATGTNITITATEVDGSTSNELQTYSHSGTTTYTNTLSNGGGSWSITGAGIAVISQTAGAVTVTATEVDGSTTNELQTIANTSDATSHTVTLSNSGGSVQLVEGTGITLTTTGTSGAGIVTVASTIPTYNSWTFSSGGGPTQTVQSGDNVEFSSSVGIALTNISGDGLQIDLSADLNDLNDVNTSGATNGQALVYNSTTFTWAPGTVTGTTDLSYTGTSSPVTLNSSTGTDVTFTQGGIVTISATGTNITISATEVDGSASNEGSITVGAGGANDSQINSNTSGSGSVTISGGNGMLVTESGSTITVSPPTGTSGQTLRYDLSGVLVANNQILNNGTEVGIGGSPISGIELYTAGRGRFDATIESQGTGTPTGGTLAAAIRLINTTPTTGQTWYVGSMNDGTFVLQSDNASTVLSSEVDGTVATVYDFKIGDVTGITPTTIIGRDASGMVGTVGVGSGLSLSGGTLSATGSGTTDLTFSGTSSPVTLNSSSGTDVTFTAGGINSFSATGTNITITATEVDGSVTNEGQVGVGAGGATSSVITSNTSGATGVTINVGGINSISETTSANGGQITITATEVDGSTSNELQTYSHAGTTTYTNTLSNGGGSWSITGAGIAVISQTAGAVTVTATEVDGSVTNEGQVGVGAGGATSSVITSNTSGATGVTINVGGINSISETTSANGGQITITATEVDGSTSNELQTYSHSGTTSYTNTLSNSGGSFTLQASGIASISHSAGTVTITATEVDGSTSNELQTYSHAGTTTYTNTLSNGGGSWSITGAGIAVISQTAGAVTVTATEVDGSTTNELQTIANTSDATSHTVTLSNSGGSVQLVEGSGITLTTTGTSGAGVVTIAATGGGGTPAGANYQVQYYNSGAFGAENVFNYDPTNNRLVVGHTTAAAVLHGRGANDVSDRVFLAENLTGNDIVAVYSQGNVKFGDNETYPIIRETNTAGGTTSYTGNGLTFESQPSATTTDVFSFYHPSVGLSSGTNNFIRQTGTWSVGSGTAIYNGITADPTINVNTTATGVVNIFNATPTVTQAAGGIRMYNATPSVTAASGGLSGYYSNIASGTNIYGVFADGTAQSRFDGSVGIKADPIAGNDLYVVGNQRNDASMLIRGAGSATGSSASATLKLLNTTAGTGDTWYLNSKDDGGFGLYSGNANLVLGADNAGKVSTLYDFQIGFVSATPTTVIGRDGSGNVGTVSLGTDVTLSAGELPLWNSNDAGGITSLTSTALADVTGLSFAVTANKKYEFRAVIKYSAAATTTGSAFSINGPAGTVQLHVRSGLTATTQFTHWQNAVNTLSASASSVYTSGNIAIVEGIVEPTANGTYIIRGATEVASSAITVQGVSNINWREIK